MNENEWGRKEGEKMNDNNWIWTVNNIGTEGARMLSKGLKSNSTLTTLYLRCDNEW